jgi:hypothetical protein
MMASSLRPLRLIGACFVCGLLITSCSSSSDLPTGTFTAQVHWTDPTLAAGSETQPFQGTVGNQILTGSATKTFSEVTSTEMLHIDGTLGTQRFSLRTYWLPAGVSCGSNGQTSCQHHPARNAVVGSFDGQPVTGTLITNAASARVNASGTVEGQNISVSWPLPTSTCCSTETTTVVIKIS